METFFGFGQFHVGNWDNYRKMRKCLKQSVPKSHTDSTFQLKKNYPSLIRMQNKFCPLEEYIGDIE